MMKKLILLKTNAYNLNLKDPRNWVPMGFILATVAAYYAACIINEDEKYVRNCLFGLIGGFVGRYAWDFTFDKYFPGVFDNFLSIVVGGFLFTLIVGFIILMIRKKKKNT